MTLILLLAIFHLFDHSIGLFALPGDPYSADRLAAALAAQQLVSYCHDTRTLFVKTALEKQYEIVSLPIYSTLSELANALTNVYMLNSYLVCFCVCSCNININR